MVKAPDRVEVCEVVLWGRVIGALAWDASQGVGTFEYEPAFRRSGIQPAPLTMPLDARLWRFPALSRDTYMGLPGLLADSLPDRFGNAVIDRWLAETGRNAADFSPIERLCTIGARGMGALEFRPAIVPRERSEPLALEALVHLARDIVQERAGLSAKLTGASEDADAVASILRVGASAGGARAKAVVAWNPASGELRSGQVPAPPGFESWLLKFDGVGSRDKELADPDGFGRVEYAYHLMARAAGIEMTDCRLLEENGRAHFMTRRFDRRDDGEKRHLQTLCAIAHLDFNQAGAHGYEELLSVALRLKLGAPALRELYRRMVFNVVARNQDDHTKNTGFLMDKRGVWTLAPAYDLTYAYNPTGAWTSRHQMTIGGKRDGFSMNDLAGVAATFGIKKAAGIHEEVRAAVTNWPAFAQAGGVRADLAETVSANLRLEILSN